MVPVLLGASLGLVLGACTTDHPTAARPAPTGGAPKPALSQYLLTGADLPGWTVRAAPSGGTPGLSHASKGCLAASALNHATTARASVSFLAPGTSSGILAETIASFPSGRGSRTWAAGTDALDDCHQMATTVDGSSVVASVHELDMAYYGGIGDQDSAFSITFTYRGVEASEDVAYVLKGNNIVSVALSEVDAGNAQSQLATLFTLATTAVGKVPEILSGHVSPA